MTGAMSSPSAPRTNGGDRLRLTYIIGTYPSLTTTFIDREITGLLRRGADVVVLSIRRPRTPLSPAQVRLQQNVRYLLPPRPMGIVAGHIRFLVRQPRTYVRSLVSILRAPHGGASRLRSLWHFAAGVEAARAASDRRGVPLHAHFVDRAATVAMVAAPLLGSSFSCTAHANDIYVRPVLLPEKVRAARFVATCTEANRRYLLERLGQWSDQRLVTIRHGIELSQFADRRGSIVDAREPVILTVAQLKEKKGIADLIAACRVLRDRSVAFSCRIVGDGPLRQELEELARTLDCSDRITFAGALPFPDVVEEYRRASVFALPCVVAADGDRDGIPNVILEAMAMSLPVVSTAISGIGEIVLDGRTGLLVRPHDVGALGDAIARLLADPSLRGRLGRAGHARVVEEFDVERSLDCLVDAISEVAA